MPTDDEFRRVAEDVRALVRSLTRDIRAAVERSRVDGKDHRAPRDGLAAAGRAARDELRRAQLAVRQSGRQRRRDRHCSPWAGEWSGSGIPPRSDNWVGHRPRSGHRFYPGGPVGPQAGDDARPGTDHGGPSARAWPAPAATAAPPLRHRHDGSTLIGLLIVVFGLAWLAAGTHLAALPVESVLALALMVLGAATVVTARTDWALSRRSWPLVAGAGLVVGLIGSTLSPALPVGFQHLQVGSRTLAPTSWSALPLHIHGGVGHTLVDLTGVPGPPPQATTLAVDGAAGRLEVQLPPEVRVIVNTRVAAGQITVNGVATGGVRRVDNEVLSAGASGPALTLDVDSGFGSVEITQLAAGAIRPPNPPPQPVLPRAQP